MDEATYKQWWPLHRRTAVGEPLSAEEQADYEAGLRQLEAEEHIGFDMAGLQEAREQIRQTEAERQQLEARRQELEARIARLEAAMSERDKQSLEIRSQV